MKHRTMRTLGMLLAGMLLSTACVAAVPSATCRARGQAALSAWTQGRGDQAVEHFAPAVAAKASPQMLEQVWTQLATTFGKFRSLGELADREVAGHEMLVAPLDFTNGSMAALVACDAQDRITTFRVVPAAAVPGLAKAAPAPAVPGVVSQGIDVPTPLGPLSGTLTLPKGAGPFPAVVLVAGSGPQDRDETIGPNKPFRDIAIGLAKTGVASLRYDKRTLVYGTKMVDKPYTVDDEVTDDALAALQVLAKQDNVDPDRLFVLGHSLGAMMAPRIGKRDPQLAGIVMLAAPARPLLEVSAAQVRELGKREHVGADKIAASEQAIKDERKLLETADPAHPPKGVFFHAPQSYWLSLHDYNQVAVAKGLDTPMLILQGGSDFQVSPEDDFAVWKKALADEPDVAFHLYPDLSHLFMPAGSTGTTADYATPGHVAPEVIHDIARWIKAQKPVM